MILAVRTVLSPIAATLVLTTLLFARLHAAWSGAEPAIAGQASTVNVSTVAQLQSAIASLTSGTTIVIAPGVYRLTEELRIRNGVTHVGVRGATSNRDDVVLLGTGMKTPGINIVLTVENAQDVTIANLSIGEAFYHPIQLQGEQGADRIRISNVRLFDAGQQFIKSTVDFQNPNGVDDVIVEHSLIEYTRIGPDHGYTQGIDVHDGANWLIHHNLFRNIHVPANAPDRLQPAILMWSGSRDTVVHSNTFLNCERGIIFGLGPQAGFDHSHSGGAIYNNFIYRTEPVNADSGISVWDSPGTRVYHNTVIQNGTYPTAIEYRFQSTTGVEIINNLTDGAIIARDGAQGLVVNNFTQATAAFFVNAAAADLHLAETASLAIDHGMDLPPVSVDWDGEPRPFGGASDLGADERGTNANQPPAAPAPGVCPTADPFASLGGGTCVNGGWLPPVQAPPVLNPNDPSLPAPVPPPPPPPPLAGCTTPDPFGSLGGGTCVNGGWLPPGLAPPAGNPTPPPSSPPPAPSPGGCTTPDPFVSLGGGTCFNGGWLPPGLSPPPQGSRGSEPATPTSTLATATELRVVARRSVAKALENLGTPELRKLGTDSVAIG